jgi:hypothetical protein
MQLRFKLHLFYIFRLNIVTTKLEYFLDATYIWHILMSYATKEFNLSKSEFLWLFFADWSSPFFFLKVNLDLGT